METFELRYFLAVARRQNIHSAAKDIAVSAPALSKAVSRLEDELGVMLFRREGRNIVLTEQGNVLQVRAAEIIRLEQAAKIEIKGKNSELNVVIAGPEIVVSSFGFSVAASVRKRYPNSTFEFLCASDESAQDLVVNGTSHLAITTRPPLASLTSRTIQSCIFLTIAGRKHALHTAARTGKKVPIDTILEHPFVCPTRGLLGKIKSDHASDGWREDLFPRRIDFITSSLKLMENIVEEGHGLAYLPDYLVEKMPGQPLSITGCPYTCRQEIRLVAKDPEKLGWLNALF